MDCTDTELLIAGEGTFTINIEDDNGGIHMI